MYSAHLLAVYSKYFKGVHFQRFWGLTGKPPYSYYIWEI